MAIILPNEKLVLNAYAVLVGETPGNAALEEHLAYIDANGVAAYESVLNSIFADQSNATLATTMLANLGLSSIFTQAEAEAFLAGNAANRVGAMINLSNALYNYSGSDAAIVAAHDAYVNAIEGSYNYSIDPTHVAGADLSGSIVSGGQTLTLTTDIAETTGSSGNDTFKGLINDDGTDNLSTVQTGDVVNGGAGTDTIEITVALDQGTAPLLELNSVETVKIRQLDGSANNIDASLWTDVTRIESNKSMDWTYVDNVQNGVVLAVTDSKDNAVEIGYADGALGTDSYEQFFDLTNVSDATTGQIDIHVDTASATDAITAINVKATGANFVEIGGGSAYGNIETVTVTGTGTLDISEHGSAFGDATTVDLSGNSGGVTIELSHEDVVVTGGSGDDVVTLSNGVALTDKAGIALGAGDDALLDGGSAGVGTAAVLDGGDGTDTIASTLLEVGNQANIQNFEILDLAGETRTIDASLFTKSTFQSLALTDTTGGDVTVSKLAGTAIVLDDSAAQNVGNTITATLKDATGTSDTGAINFSGDASSTLAGFKTAGLETFTIDSMGDDSSVANELTLLTTTDNVLTKITITGDNDFTLGGVTTNSAATTATADVASALTTIDGSDATGNLDITAGASAAIGATAFNTTYKGLTILTGTGDDTVTIGNTGTVSTDAGADTVNVAVLGVSVDVGTDEDADTVVLAVTADYTGATTSATKMTTISHLAAGDTIDFSAIESAAVAITDYTATALTFGSFEAAVDAALTAGGDNLINWVDGNTYLVVDGTDNTIIKLVGSYDAADLSVASGVVTFA